MRHTSSAVLLSAAATLAALHCSSSTSTSSCGSGTAPSVVGTYALLSYTIGSTTITSADGASGELRFYTGTYGFNISIPGQGAIADSGIYAITGTKCMSQQSVLGGGKTTGTFTVTGTAPVIFSFSGTNNLLSQTVGFSGQRQ